MAQFVNLNPGSLRELHVGNERLVSYNVEMTEVTGGTFWKAYTPAQIAGTEPFVLKGGFLGNATASTDLMQYYDPIDLSDKKLRKLAKEIGPAGCACLVPGPPRPITTLTAIRTASSRRATTPS